MINQNIIKVYFATFLINLTFFSPIATLFFQSRGLNYSQILFMISWFMIWALIFEIPFGALADLIKRKYVLLLSTVMYIIATILIAFSHKYPLFLLGQFIWAIAVASFSGTNNSLIYDSLKETSEENFSKKIFANLKIVTTVSLIVASFIGGFLAEINLSYPQLFYSIPVLFSFLAYLTIKEPKIKQNEKINFVGFCNKIKNSLHISLKEKVLFSIILNSSIISAFFGVIVWLWQPLMKNYGVTFGELGIIFAVANLLSIFLLKKLIFIERLFKPKNLFIISSLLPGVLLIIMPLINSLYFVILTILSVVMLMSIRDPLFNHYVNMHTISKQRTTVLSVKAFFNRASCIIILPLFGIIADKISLNFMFFILGVLIILSSIIFKIEQTLCE